MNSALLVTYFGACVYCKLDYTISHDGLAVREQQQRQQRHCPFPMLNWCESQHHYAVVQYQTPGQLLGAAGMDYRSLAGILHRSICNTLCL